MELSTDERAQLRQLVDECLLPAATDADCGSATKGVADDADAADAADTADGEDGADGDVSAGAASASEESGAPPPLDADRAYDALVVLMRDQSRLAMVPTSGSTALASGSSGPERELMRRFDAAFPTGWGDSASRADVVLRLCGLWRQMRGRLIAPLRTATRSFFAYMRLSEEQHAAHPGVSAPLRLLKLLVRHPAELQADFAAGLVAVPPMAWRGVVPQLFARLNHPEPFVRAHVQALLCAIGETMPELVLYPALVGIDETPHRLQGLDALRHLAGGPQAEAGHHPRGEGAAGARGARGATNDGAGNAPSQGRTERLAICDSLRAHSPRLVEQLQLLISELGRVTLLWEDHLSSVLSQLQSEVVTRINKLREEAKRVNQNAKLTQADKARIVGEKYAAIMAPVLATLERNERALSGEASTPHERDFQATTLVQFRKAIDVFRATRSAKFEEGWEPMRESRATPSCAGRPPPLMRISPLLAAQQAAHPCRRRRRAYQQRRQRAQQRSLPPPAGRRGLHIRPTATFLRRGWRCRLRGSIATPGAPPSDDVGGICIERLGETMEVLPTKTRPKKLVLVGSDGKRYTYLLKGREDLHLDERIMQLLRVVSGLLRTERHTRAYPAVRARSYVVLPLGRRAGLIQWVGGVTPLFTLYKEWRMRAQAAAALKEGCGGGGGGAGEGGGGGGGGGAAGRGVTAAATTAATASGKEAATNTSASSSASGTKASGNKGGGSSTSASSTAGTGPRTGTGTGTGGMASSAAASAGTTGGGSTGGAAAGAVAPADAGGGAGAGEGAGGGAAPPLGPVADDKWSNAMAFRPSDIFYAKLAPALEAVNLDPNLPRRQWPHDVLRRVHAELVAETPKDLIAHELWLQSADSHEWWLKTQAFARSAGVMSMLGYAVGLGDRHLDNILLDLSSGELLHIDYNVCFEKAALKVSEMVPFRMTQRCGGTGVGGTDGALRRAASR